MGEEGIIEKITLAGALKEITDKKIRAVYSKKAIMQAKKFQWEEFAQQILRCMNV